jgi:hypothetical protein
MSLHSLHAFAERIGEFIARSTTPRTCAPADAEFEQLARELFALQFQSIEVYRRYCERLNRTPENVRSWKEIPRVPTSAFKDFELTSLPPCSRIRTFCTSGTTGQRPGRHFHSLDSLQLYQRSVLPWFKHHLLSDRDRIQMISLIPPADAVPTSSLASMLHSVRCELGTESSCELGVANADGNWEVDKRAVVEAMTTSSSQSSPVLVMGTAYGWVQLLDYLIDQGCTLKLPAGSRVMETGGYKGRTRVLKREELHQLISRRLAVPESHIVSEYGMSELSSQAYDRKIGTQSPRRFRFPPWCRVKIDPLGRPGDADRRGLIEVVDLVNVWSVLGVQTEDLGIAREDGFEYAGRVAEAEPRGCSLMQA